MVQIQNTKHRHLTQEQRLFIYKHYETLSYRAIGREIGKDHTVVKREIERNGSYVWGKQTYDPMKAQKRAKKRRYKANTKQRKIVHNSGLKNTCIRLLDQRSPDAIIGRLKLMYPDRDIPSTATLYRYIRHYNPTLQRKLRFKNHGYRTCKKGNKRTKIYKDVPNISQRPEHINNRSEIGHREGDTVLSNRKAGGGVVSMAERVSRYYIIKKVSNLRAKTVTDILQEIIQSEDILSITFDNGTEFSDIGILHVQCYRADPYCSGQRGTNERHNGLLRVDIPKGSDFADWSDEELQCIVDKINNTPRKILGYRTPYEVYYATTKQYI